MLAVWLYVYPGLKQPPPSLLDSSPPHRLTRPLQHYPHNTREQRHRHRQHHHHQLRQSWQMVMGLGQAQLSTTQASV
jgi:hypothetical protein